MNTKIRENIPSVEVRLERILTELIDLQGHAGPMTCLFHFHTEGDDRCVTVTIEVGGGVVAH